MKLIMVEYEVCLIVVSHCIVGPSEELGDQDQPGLSKEKHR